jgi:hypothetical protein
MTRRDTGNHSKAQSSSEAADLNRRIEPEMTTDYEPSLPTLPALSLPPPPVPVPSEAIPFLPSAVPAQPSAPAPVAFDAKAMVDSQRRKIENPVYGHMPSGTPEGKLAAEEARKSMRRRRRRNKRVAMMFLAVFGGAVATGAYFGFKAYQDDQNGEPASVDGELDPSVIEQVNPGGAVTPIGEQAQVIDALDDVNSGATPSAGGVLAAIDQAREVVGQTNPPNPPTPSASLMPYTSALPPEIVDAVIDRDTLNGYDRFVVDIDQASQRSPEVVTAWLASLSALPQAATVTSDPSLLVSLQPTQILVAVKAPAGEITDLVVVAGDGSLLIDL